MAAVLCWRLIFFAAATTVGTVGQGESAPDPAPISALAAQAHLTPVGSITTQDEVDNVGPYAEGTFQGTCDVLYPAAQTLGYTSQKGLSATTCAVGDRQSDTFTTPDGAVVHATWPPFQPGQLTLTIGTR